MATTRKLLGFVPIAVLLGAATLAHADTKEASSLDDGGILYVAHVANTGEIEKARLAESRGTDPRVRRFAQLMHAHHSDADRNGTAIAKQQEIEAKASPQSDQLRKEGAASLERLGAASAVDFDRRYIDVQVTAHAKVLSLIDDKLLPSAKDQAVRAHLREIRPKVAGHLEQALVLQQSLMKK